MQTKTIGFVLLFVLAQPVGAQEVGPARADESAAPTRPAKPRPRSEAEYYAAGFGVPIAEAERRVRLMEARGDEAVDLRVEFKRRFAGIYLDHLPDLRIVVRLTGNTPVASRLAVNKEGNIPIVFVTGAKATLDELEAVLDVHQKALYAKIPALQGLYTDDRTGEIVLVVHASAAEAKIYEAEVPALVKLLGHPVRFEFESAPTKEAALARERCGGDRLHDGIFRQGNSNRPKGNIDGRSLPKYASICELQRSRIRYLSSGVRC